MKKILQDAGYVFDAQVNVWSNPDYKGIAYNDGDEIETRIANIIRDAHDITTLSTELRQHITDWPSQYHLTSERANIMRPFATTLKDAQVLEIGAGCGAISRFLGECGAAVLSLEGSPRRASIARSRTRDLDNVTVLTEKFDQFQCAFQFEVITLIGVLEYANLFTPGDNPALSMLQRVKQLLKPNGKLIIAIENQLGLKYFAGAPEDHFGVPMIGIEGRYGKNQAQTFGRSALTKLLQQAGFIKSHFLAPFPDYKLPTSIVTEAGFSHPHFDAAAFASQSVRRDPQMPEVCHFSPELAWPVLFANDLGLELANSFLIIASPLTQELVQADELAYHYSTTRLAQYCKETIFASQDSQTVTIAYRRLDKSPIKSNQSVTSSYSPIQFVAPATATYVSGKQLSQEFINIITRDGWTYEQIGQFVQRYLTILETFKAADHDSPFTDTDANLMIGEYLDCIPQNIMIDEQGSATYIDKEWQLVSPVEIKHLVFRSILMMCAAITRFGAPAKGSSITVYQLIEQAFQAAGLKLSDEDTLRFEAIEKRIQVAVSGMDTQTYFELQKIRILPTKSTAHLAYLRHQHIEQLNQRIDDLQNSASGRLMSPLRLISGKIKSLLS